MKYSDKLKDPRWQKKRLEILKRDDFTCQMCGETAKTLHVHHKIYTFGKDPWDYPPDHLITLCEDCHENERECMEAQTGKLLRELKSKFLSDDIEMIADGFVGLEISENRDYYKSAIWIFLRDPELIKIAYDKYAESA